MQTVWNKKNTAPRRLSLGLAALLWVLQYIYILAAKSQPEAWNELPDWKK